MPYKNPEDRRRYDRERRSAQRGLAAAPAPELAAETRIKIAEDVEGLLAEAVRLAHRDPTARDVEKARVLNSIAGTAMRLLEVHGLQERVEEIEHVMRIRRTGFASIPALPRRASPEAEAS
jgi:hypothetical protein